MAREFGFDEFVDKLENMQQDFENKSIELLEKTGDTAVAEIQMRTPVDTGTLRRSMTREPVNTSELSVRTGTSLHYAPHVEYGHRVGFTGFVAGRFMVRDGGTVAGRRFAQDGVRMMRDLTKEFR